MEPYIGVVHQDAGSAYGITPDAPGCFSASDSLDDLFDKAEEALGLWLEEPSKAEVSARRPRDLTDLKRDPDWSESFADAVLVIALRPQLVRLDAA